VSYFASGSIILVISVCISALLVKRHATEQDKTVKAVLFGLYFWGLVFFQLIICALLYVLLKR
jgi:hypothetical protein